MLTSKQIKELPKGNYPNWRLRELFPKQQGDGYSAKFIQVIKVKEPGKEGQMPSVVTKLINYFTGKEVIQKKIKQRTTNK